MEQSARSMEKETAGEHSKTRQASDSEAITALAEWMHMEREEILRQDQHRFPVRDDMTADMHIHLGDNNADTVQKYLASRFLWMRLPHFQWARGTSVCDDRTCKALLRSMRATIHTCARDTSWSGSATSSNFYISRIFGFHPETFPERVVSLLSTFLGDWEYALWGYQMNMAILALESTLDTCLGIPKLRPFFMALAESRIIHICSRIRDYLLAIVYLPCTEHDSSPPDFLLYFGPQTLESYYELFNGCTDIALLTVRDLLDTVGKVNLADVNAVKSLAEIRVRGLSLLEINRMLQITLGAGPETPELKTEYCRLLCVFYKFESDEAARASTCYKRLLDLRAEGPSPFFRDILTCRELDDFLVVKDAECECTGLLDGEMTKCRECVLRLFYAQKQLYNTLENDFLDRQPGKALLFKVIKLFLKEGTQHIQQLAAGEIHNYWALLGKIQHWVDWLMASRVLTPLRRISVLTSKFSDKFMISGNVREGQRELYTTCLIGVNSPAYIFDKKATKLGERTAFDVFKRDMAKANDDLETWLEKVYENCAMEILCLQEHLKVLEENSKNVQPDCAPEGTSVETIVYDVMDYLLKIVENRLM